MYERWQHGRQMHGKEWNGKHPLWEAYEESLDLAVYVRLCNGDANNLTGKVDSLCAELRALLKAADKSGIDLSVWTDQRDMSW